MKYEALLICACLFIYAYVFIFTHLYLYDAEEYKSLGDYRTLLAFLWPILFVRKAIDLFVWVCKGVKEIFKFIVK